jgi:hypothetical protein
LSKVKASDITVTFPALFADLQPVWMMMHTCERFGITPLPYGIGQTYGGWVDIKIYRLLEVAKNCPTSHLLYTDARDAWFLSGLEEVAEKYNAYGAPPLMLSSQPEPFCTYIKWYEGLDWNKDIRFRYVSPPGQLCEAAALAEVLQWMLDRRASGDWGEMPDDDPPWWLNFMKERPGELVIDHACQIFQNCGDHMEEGMWENVLEIKDGRVHNRITDSYPCLLHFNGGSSDALKGKWTELEPFWRKFGYTKNPPWEGR